jgi:hypothetical protein
MMRISDVHVDVKGPRVQAVIVYRSWDDDGWGSLTKSFLSDFGPVDMGNIEAARSYVRMFNIGEEEQ